jgi:hypothetical protein
VIGDHPQRLGVEICRSGPSGRLDQGLEQIDLVVAVHMLQHRRDALEAHTRVHRGLRQRRHLAAGVAVVLHEDEVPDLDIAIESSSGYPAARRARPDRGRRRSPSKDRRGPCRPSARNCRSSARRRDTLRPGKPISSSQICSAASSSSGVYRDPERSAGSPSDLGEKLPGVTDRVALEIVTEAEVAQHLEEGVMPRRVADVFEVIVLAAGPHAALRADRADVGRLSAPRKTSLNWFIPALVNSRVGSSAGTSELLGTRWWPWASK